MPEKPPPHVVIMANDVEFTPQTPEITPVFSPSERSKFAGRGIGAAFFQLAAKRCLAQIPSAAPQLFGFGGVYALWHSIKNTIFDATRCKA